MPYSTQHTYMTLHPTLHGYHYSPTVGSLRIPLAPPNPSLPQKSHLPPMPLHNRPPTTSDASVAPGRRRYTSEASSVIVIDSMLELIPLTFGTKLCTQKSTLVKPVSHSHLQARKALLPTCAVLQRAAQSPRHTSPPIPHLTTLPQHITCLKCQQTFPSSSFLHHCRTTHRHTPHRELWSPSLSPFYRQCGVCWTLCPIGTFSSHIRKGDCCATPGMAQIAIQDPITSAPAEWQCCRCTFTCTDPATYLAHLSFHLQGLPPESLDAWIINPAYSHIVQHCSLCNLFYYNPHSSSVSSTHDCPPPSPRPTNTTSTSLRTALPRPPLHFLKPTESLTLLHHATPPLPDHVPFQESLHSPCPTLAPTSGFVAPSPSPPLATTARIALLDNTSTVLGSSLLHAVAPSPNPQLRLRVTAAVMVQETAAHHPTSSLATPPPSPPPWTPPQKFQIHLHFPIPFNRLSWLPDSPPVNPLFVSPFILRFLHLLPLSRFSPIIFRSTTLTTLLGTPVMRFHLPILRIATLSDVHAALTSHITFPAFWST